MAVLRVILFLLKLLGILLLVILGLLLLVALLTLFAPVRYKAKLKKEEEPEPGFFADGLISWLNPFLRVRILFREKKLRYTVRVLGIPLLDSERPPKEKKRKRKEEECVEEDITAQEPRVTEAKETEEKPQEVPAKVEAELSENKRENGPEEGLTERSRGAEDSVEEERTERKKKEGIFKKIKKLIEKLKTFPKTVKEKVLHVTERIKLLWKKKEAVGAFLADELHKAAMGTALGTVKKIFSHILPRKIKGTVEFGTGDPESTGKALAVLGILYAAYGKGFTIVPDFTEKRLVAEVYFRGRIRFVTLLRHGIRFLRDKQVRRFYKDFKKLGNLLKEKAE